MGRLNINGGSAQGQGGHHWSRGCFRGGFYAALSGGVNFEEAAFVGSATASHSLQETGGQEHLPSFEQLLEFIED